jgi:hypothetical protein
MSAIDNRSGSRTSARSHVPYYRQNVTLGHPVHPRPGTPGVSTPGALGIHSADPVARQRSAQRIAGALGIPAMVQGHGAVYTCPGMRPLRIAAVFALLLNSITAHASAGDVALWWSGLLGGADPNAGSNLFPALLSPLGGRVEGMGTAASAVAVDAGFLEANPAVTAVLKSTELAFSHHDWIADSSIEGVVYAVRFGDLGIGASAKLLHVPFTAYNAWGARQGSGTISEGVATLNVAYNFARSYEFAGIAAGASLKGVLRSVPAAIAPGQSLFGVLADVGLQTCFSFLRLPSLSPSRNFSLGVVLRNVGLAASLGGTELQSDERLPLTVSGGIAWSPLGPLTVATDLNVPVGLNAPLPEIAVGTNVSVTDFLSVQGGVLLRAGNPRISLGTNLDLPIVSLTVNYNLDLSARLAAPGDLFSAQARFNLGDRGRGALAAQVEQLYNSGLAQYVAGNYSQAIEQWKRVLELDADYTPARNYLRIVQESLDSAETLAPKVTE